MPELSLPTATRPLSRPPFPPNALEPESQYPGVWDWTPRDAPAMGTVNLPLQAKRPLGGSEGVPDTQPDTDDLLNIALTVIAGIGITVAITSLVRSILPRR
ncbi:hypothetical protein AEAC466_07450 [Asticcacaulis sp. AC466]|uniref:hypothetical protein n=1 Tax=Asticcacaulis sp. AC466 TaxID=1282362 RepID=UPI0003C3EB09|nr:hypothetical protein [Asticcacaulis sp. AC466]ESQ84884.1 hypothetical protein AEAC466_07450 [Asticcacaulis sp. AC466]